MNIQSGAYQFHKTIVENLTNHEALTITFNGNLLTDFRDDNKLVSGFILSSFNNIPTVELIHFEDINIFIDFFPIKYNADIYNKYKEFFNFK